MAQVLPFKPSNNSQHNRLRINATKKTTLPANTRITMGSKGWYMLDAHAWCVNADGSIYDPWFKHYDTVCTIRGCDPDKIRYKPMPEWTADYFTMIKAEMMIQTENVKTQWDAIAESYPVVVYAGPSRVTNHVYKMFCDNPQPRMCFINAYAYKRKNPDAKLVVGKMGWQNCGRGNGVWWEYG